MSECLPDLDQDVAVLHMTLLHLGRIVESSIQTLLVPDGLEISEHSVLTALWFAGPPHTMSPTQLSLVILQTTSGMSKTLRRVEGLGLIERVAERHLRQLIEQWSTQLKDVGTSDLSDIAKAVWSLVRHMDPRSVIGAAEISADEPSA